MGVYDPVRQRVLAIDVGSSPAPIALYAFEATPDPHWHRLQVAGSPARAPYLGSVVYDTVRDRLLVIGSDFDESIGVWAVSLSSPPTWEEIKTQGNPSRRWGHSTIYDPIRDEVVTFGLTLARQFLDVRRIRLGDMVLVAWDRGVD
jgi:hypothetical protein